MAESVEEYAPNSNNSKIVNAVNIVAENQQDSHPQRSLRIMVAMQTKVEATKQIQFPTNLCTIIGMKKHVTKLLKVYDIDANLSIRLLTAALGMHRNYLVETKI